MTAPLRTPALRWRPGRYSAPCVTWGMPSPSATRSSAMKGNESAFLWQLPQQRVQQVKAPVAAAAALTILTAPVSAVGAAASLLCNIALPS